jgi:DNA-binding PadR family transcriptional regulator
MPEDTTPERRYFDLAEAGVEEIAEELWEMVRAARAGESGGDGADEESSTG